MDGMEAFEVFGQMAVLEIFRPTGGLEVHCVGSPNESREEREPIRCESQSGGLTVGKKAVMTPFQSSPFSIRTSKGAAKTPQPKMPNDDRSSTTLWNRGVSIVISLSNGVQRVDRFVHFHS